MGQNRLNVAGNDPERSQAPVPAHRAKSTFNDAPMERLGPNMPQGPGPKLFIPYLPLTLLIWFKQLGPNKASLGRLWQDLKIGVG